MIHGDARDTPRTRRAVGAWLAGAVCTDASQPQLAGLLDGANGWTYATDGKRIHGVSGYADRLGGARCPWTGVKLELEEGVPDVAAVLDARPEPDAVAMVSATALLSACRGLLTTAKGVNGSHRAELRLDPAEERLLISVHLGAEDQVAGGLVVKECAFHAGSAPVTTRVSLAYLVHALGGPLKLDKDAQVELSAMAQDGAPLVIRYTPPDGLGVAMIAWICSIRYDGDGGTGRQDVLPELLNEDPGPRQGQLELKEEPAPLDRKSMAAGEKPERETVRLRKAQAPEPEPEPEAPPEPEPEPEQAAKAATAERARRYRARKRGEKAARAGQERTPPNRERYSAEWFAGYDKAAEELAQ